ncbi:hypothetical protein ETAA8_06180 [Anatilimnocola aggregata]|uniref:Uncharacterized protein n=1 Tax=Anatilimnocola aggregata TaxID=2528021 RepID=A0A517Y5M8_9BACT|nr:hypothetical protein [Anatilimnocola aggregata]QDU25549.1 hypothetical protein ETAA8_06180 [Anatilimnocola aggregata]
MKRFTRSRAVRCALVCVALLRWFGGDQLVAADVNIEAKKIVQVLIELDWEHDKWEKLKANFDLATKQKNEWANATDASLLPIEVEEGVGKSVFSHYSTAGAGIYVTVERKTGQVVSVVVHDFPRTGLELKIAVAGRVEESTYQRGSDGKK